MNADAQAVISSLASRIAMLEVDNAVLRSIVSAYEAAEDEKGTDDDDAE
jgi:hypothetical protein